MNKNKIIGLRRKKVVLLSYNPAWKKLYEEEKKLISFVIGEQALDIQHVGSTSIPGVKSKPIIDIAIGVESLKDRDTCIKPLEEMGYQYKNDSGVKGRYFFVKGSEDNRTHYIHLVKLNSEQWKNFIFFRDYLRKNKKAVEKYNILKEKIAEKYKDDRDTYTLRKSIFIKKVIKEFKKTI